MRIFHIIKAIFFLDMKVTRNFFFLDEGNYNSFTNHNKKKENKKICDAELKIQPLYLLGKSYHGSKNFQRSSTCS